MQTNFDLDFEIQNFLWCGELIQAFLKLLVYSPTMMESNFLIILEHLFHSLKVILTQWQIMLLFILFKLQMLLKSNHVRHLMLVLHHFVYLRISKDIQIQFLPIPYLQFHKAKFSTPQVEQLRNYSRHAKKNQILVPICWRLHQVEPSLHVTVDVGTQYWMVRILILMMLQ